MIHLLLSDQEAEWLETHLRVELQTWKTRNGGFDWDAQLTEAQFLQVSRLVLLAVRLKQALADR